jgi:hypothetical protein
MQPEWDGLETSVADAQKMFNKVDTKYSLVQKTEDRYKKSRADIRSRMIRLQKVQSRKCEQLVTDNETVTPEEEYPSYEADRATHFSESSSRRTRSGYGCGKVCQKIEQKTQNMPDAQSDRRGPHTDRPPDKPPPWKGAIVGILHERASSRHASQLASSRGFNGLSGNASPAQKCNLRVKRPSNQSHASAAGSSQEFTSVRSWMHTSGHQYRVKRDPCVTNGHPSSNLGRNLFPSRRFSCRSPNHRVQWHSVTTVTRHRCVAQRERAPSALRALVRCSHPPRWGQTK